MLKNRLVVTIKFIPLYLTNYETVVFFRSYNRLACTCLAPVKWHWNFCSYFSYFNEPVVLLNKKYLGTHLKIPRKKSRNYQVVKFGKTFLEFFIINNYIRIQSMPPTLSRIYKHKALSVCLINCCNFAS